MRWRNLPDWLERKIAPEPNTGCWLWMGKTNAAGYGIVCNRDGFIERKAHRVVYETLCAPIPAGLQIDHLCRMRCCVNPDHMEVVTNRVNTLRGVGPTAVNARKRLCQEGHPLEGWNVIWRGHMRTCRTCKYHKNAIAAARRRALL